MAHVCEIEPEMVIKRYPMQMTDQMFGCVVEKGITVCITLVNCKEIVRSSAAKMTNEKHCTSSWLTILHINTEVIEIQIDQATSSNFPSRLVKPHRI
jgi:hypothetical protein